MTQSQTGILYVVATPIGNLEDITLRAIQILKQVQAIAAEDTRHSHKLLQAYDINTPLFSVHEHNEREQTTYVLERLKNGEDIALISDAGTPLISDPGYYLIHTAREQGFHVVPIPGACAAIAALSVSGLPTDHFIFEGFLPAKAIARRHRLTELHYETRTIVLYESVHRIIESLEDMRTVWGADRRMVMARELTKTYETILAGTINELLERICADLHQQRGEFVLIAKGYAPTTDHILTPEQETVLKILLEELHLKQAAHLAAKITHAKKNDLYERALQLKEE